jgi:hypothetical protein
MGLENNEAGKYITIFDGKFTQKVNKPDSIVSPEDIAKFLTEKKVVSRVNKVGTTVYERYHDSFTGTLLDVKVKDGKYGKQWVFSFKDQEDVYNLQLNYLSKLARNIIKMLPNADLSIPMKLSPKMVVDAKGMKEQSIFINQNGVALKHYFTKDNPRGMPSGKEVMVNGAMVWDNTETMLFLKDMVMKNIKPKLEGTNYQPVDNTPIEYPADVVNPDDIPF